jgi:threonine/homoserine/homoserine lactone efflux protein
MHHVIGMRRLRWLVAVTLAFSGFGLLWIASESQPIPDALGIVAAAGLLWLGWRAIPD